MREKEKSRLENQGSNVLLLKQLMKGRWWLLVVAFLTIVLAALASYATPLVLRTTIDSIIGDSPLEVPTWVARLIASIGGTSVLAQNLWICSLLLVFFAIVRSACRYLQGRSTAAVGEYIAEDLRNTLYNHIQHLSFEYHVGAETGDLLQRSSSDVDMVRRFTSTQLVAIADIVFSTILGLIIMLSLNVKLSVLALSIVPIILPFSYWYARKMRAKFNELQQAEAKLSTTIQESVSGVRVVRAFGQQQQEMDKFDVTNAGFRDNLIGVNYGMALFWGGTELMIYIVTAVMTAYSAYLVIRGELSLGTMIAFSSYVGMLLWPLRQLGRMLADFTRADVAFTRINEILGVPAEPTDGVTREQPLQGDIVFDQVSFTYPDGTHVLKNVSFSVKAGQTVAILGPTGAGKSTLVHLLQRLYEYDAGHIFVDGLEITEYNRKWLRSNVGMVLQEPFLYSRDLRGNIAITNPQVSEEQLEEATQIAALSGMISEFDKGYDTEVGERGVTLSGGQKQRVAIARTVLQKTPILIFDDSLSAVDTETDQMIRRELNNRETQTTTFIISHRITTLSEADIILVLENGEIVQQGTHEQLIQQEGLYRRVWQIQGANQEPAQLTEGGNTCHN